MLVARTPSTAARDWRRIAWDLGKFARGDEDDAIKYAQINVDYPAARKRFYDAARAELGIASGEIPDASSH